MSSSLLRVLNRNAIIVARNTVPRIKNNLSLQVLYVLPNYYIVAHYSRRSDSKNLDSVFKVVKSKVRVEG